MYKVLTYVRYLHIKYLLCFIYMFVYNMFLGYCKYLTPKNAQINATKSPIRTGFYPVGTNIHFSCDSGYNLTDYKLIGSDSSSCNASGFWNAPPPTCKQGNEMSRNCFFLCILLFISTYFKIETHYS